MVSILSAGRNSGSYSDSRCKCRFKSVSKPRLSSVSTSNSVSRLAFSNRSYTMSQHRIRSSSVCWGRFTISSRSSSS